MTVSLHKLTAGDGYTYLTRQVAAADGTERGYTSLGDYYAAKGESPGRWWGRGLDALGTGGAVSEQQMLNLFGQGIHPDAERIVQERYAAGRHRAAGLRRDPAGPGVPGVRGHEGVADPAGGAVRRLEPGRTGTRTTTRSRRTSGPGSAPRWPGRCSPNCTAGTRCIRGSCPGSSAQQSRPDSVRGRRVRPDVLPGEVGVHPVGGRPPGGFVRSFARMAVDAIVELVTVVISNDRVVADPGACSKQNTRIVEVERRSQSVISTGTGREAIPIRAT